MKYEQSSLFFFTKQTYFSYNFNFHSFQLFKLYSWFKFLTFTPLILFFQTLKINIPQLFSKVYSYKRIVNQNSIISFLKLFIRKGKTFKITLILIKTLSTFITFFFKKKTSLEFIFFTQLFLIYFNPLNLIEIKSAKKWEPLSGFIKTFISSFLLKYKLIYALSVQKISKQIRKFSRGKSGKYSYIWKYLPVYKRKKYLWQLFFKTLALQSAQNVSKRFNDLLHSFFFQFSNNWFFKMRQFILNYVFLNFKNSLLLTLRSTS